MTSEESEQKIIAQVEFYFSDANLSTDKFMLKHTGRNGTNPVPLSVIAGFKRMKLLSSDLAQIIDALSHSTKLVVSYNEQDVPFVARNEPLGAVDFSAVKARTVVAENLSFDPLTIDNVKAHFSKCGEVLLVRICTPPAPQATTPVLDAGVVVVEGAAIPIVPQQQQHPFKNDPILQKICRTFALIEYATEEEAALAAEKLTESGSWRGGMSVRVLGKSKSKPKKGKKAPASSASPAATAAAVAKAVAAVSLENSPAVPNALANAVGAPVFTPDRDGKDIERVTNYKGFKRRDRSSGEGAVLEATAASQESQGGGAPSSQVVYMGVKGPDGTRGFVGRGKPIVATE